MLSGQVHLCQVYLLRLADKFYQKLAVVNFLNNKISNMLNTFRSPFGPNHITIWSHFRFGLGKQNVNMNR